MSSPSTSLFSINKNYDSIIAGIIGALVIFLLARHGGIGISPDSIVYLSTARNVVYHGQFNEFTGNPITDFPIGYPTFLSIFLFITRIDFLQSGQFINMLLFFTLIYLSGSIINHLTSNKWVKIPFLAIITFSPTLLGIYTMLWSETLFLVMILLFFIALYHYGRLKTVNALIVVGIIAGLSCIIRYAGVTLVGAGGLMILFDRDLKIGKKVVHLLIFGFLGILFMVANLYRNFLVTNMLMGNREKSLTSFFQNVEKYSYVFSDFFYFHSFPLVLVLLIGVFFPVFYILSHLKHIYVPVRYYHYWNICAAFFTVYTLFIILSATFSRFEAINFRLLSPLYLPCLFPFAFVIPWSISKQTSWRKPVFIGLFVVLFGAISYSQYKENKELWEMAKDAGIPGYTEDCWRTSPLINYIKQNKQLFNKDTKIYSDGNQAIYLHTGLPAELIPHKENKIENKYFLEEQEDDYYLVWFYEDTSPEYLNFPKLLKNHTYKPIGLYPEGCIFYHPANTK